MPPLSKAMPGLHALQQAGRLSLREEEMSWHCPVCGVVVPIEIAGYYARRSCQCQIQAREQQERASQQRIFEEARLAHAYGWLGRQWAEIGLREKRFDNFDGHTQAKAFAGVQVWAQKPEGVLLLTGSFGTGKTHLLASLANACCAQGRSCLFASTVSLFDAIGERIGQQRGYHELIAQAIGTPLLLLDDVDKLKGSEFREETLYKIINGRYVTGRPLALSCNCEPDELVCWIGCAGLSRLMQQITPFSLSGVDYRMVLREQTFQQRQNAFSCFIDESIPERIHHS